MKLYKVLQQKEFYSDTISLYLNAGDLFLLDATTSKVITRENVDEIRKTSCKFTNVHPNILLGRVTVDAITTDLQPGVVLLYKIDDISVIFQEIA